MHGGVLVAQMHASAPTGRASSTHPGSTKAAEVAVESGPTEWRRDQMARKLQGFLKQRFAAKQRADAKLFGMLSRMRGHEKMTSHWGVETYDS